MYFLHNKKFQRTRRTSAFQAVRMGLPLNSTLLLFSPAKLVDSTFLSFILLPKSRKPGLLTSWTEKVLNRCKEDLVWQDVPAQRAKMYKLITLRASGPPGSRATTLDTFVRVLVGHYMSSILPDAADWMPKNFSTSSSVRVVPLPSVSKSSPSRVLRRPRSLTESIGPPGKSGLVLAV